MNRLVNAILLFLLAFTLVNTTVCQNSSHVYLIRLDLTNAPTGKKVVLQKYTGIKQVAIDSLIIGSNAEMKFCGDRLLVQGMYSLTCNKKLLANFFISNPKNQNFPISLDLKNPAQTLAFTGSPKNQAFIGYLRFLSEQ